MAAPPPPLPPTPADPGVPVFRAHALRPPPPTLLSNPPSTPDPPSDPGAPVFRARALRHPTLVASSTPFVPNDVELGGEGPPFVVLTGPNMGGKSTLMRQVTLACVMAQVSEAVLCGWVGSGWVGQGGGGAMGSEGLHPPSLKPAL